MDTFFLAVYCKDIAITKELSKHNTYSQLFWYIGSTTSVSGANVCGMMLMIFSRGKASARING